MSSTTSGAGRCGLSRSTRPRRPAPPSSARRTRRWSSGAAGPGNPYIDHAELERALRDCRADFAWVGWGFVAEDPAFAELCERIGVTFIGPPPDAMRRLGDKIAAKLLAEEVGVPVAAWSGGPVVTDEDALRHAAAIGFPLMIKAAAGGGGPRHPDRGVGGRPAPRRSGAHATRPCARSATRAS